MKNKCQTLSKLKQGKHLLWGPKQMLSNLNWKNQVKQL